MFCGAALVSTKTPSVSIAWLAAGFSCREYITNLELTRALFDTEKLVTRLQPFDHELLNSAIVAEPFDALYAGFVTEPG